MQDQNDDNRAKVTDAMIDAGLAAKDVQSALNRLAALAATPSNRDAALAALSDLQAAGRRIRVAIATWSAALASRRVGQHPDSEGAQIDAALDAEMASVLAWLDTAMTEAAAIANAVALAPELEASG